MANCGVTFNQMFMLGVLELLKATVISTLNPNSVTISNRFPVVTSENLTVKL